MFFLLSKILSYLLLPVAWIFILLVLALVWQKKRLKFLMPAFAVFYLFGNSFILTEVTRLWETKITLDENLQEYKVGVVLGGFSEHDPETGRIAFNRSGDRMLQALRLYRMGVIDKILISGGSGSLVHNLSEGEAAGAFLDQLNIPRRDIIIEAESRNTHENAAFTAAILQAKNLDRQPVLLITSAFHMPRALACFKKQGLDVAPYACNPSVGSKRLWYFNHLFLPSSHALFYWETLIHEWVGYIAYWAMGYI